MERVDRPPRARRLPPILLSVLIAGSLACQSWWSETSDYQPVGNPQLDFEEAKVICEKEATFTTAGGDRWVDWDEFESCMKPKGWVRR